MSFCSGSLCCALLLFQPFYRPLSGLPFINSIPFASAHLASWAYLPPRAPPLSNPTFVIRNGAPGTDEPIKKQSVHFIGIGGSGLSALAFYALKQGWQVSGSDISWSKTLDSLQDAGARVHVGHDPAYLWDENGQLPDHVVVSSAIPSSNEEIIMAQELNIPTHKRGSWLAKVTKSHDLIAVSGSHGKSTTAAMLSVILNNVMTDVSAVVGAEVPQFPGGGSTLSGKGPHFILEADEYDGCFLSLCPYLTLITNVEWEHVDKFPDEASVRDIFKRFAMCLRPGGTLIICGDDAGARSVTAALVKGEVVIEDGFYQKVVTPLDSEKYHIVSYGLRDGNNWCAINLKPNMHGGTDYFAVCNKKIMARVSLKIPGVHNVLNSLAAIVAAVTVLELKARTLGDAEVRFKVKKKAAEAASRCLQDFIGVRRRFEFVGMVQGFHIYDDYAHHPTEVRAVLEATRQNFDQKPVWVVFQPHTFSRLANLLEDFASAFNAADHVIVTEPWRFGHKHLHHLWQVYASREENHENISGLDLANMIRGPSAVYIPKLEDVCAYLLSEHAAFRNRDCAQLGDTILLTLGAGDVTSVGPRLLEAVSKNPD